MAVTTAPHDTRMARDVIRAPHPGISALWSKAFTVLLCVVLALGGVAYVSTQYQRSAFAETTGRYEEQVDAVVDLVRELRSIDVPMGSIFYGFGTRPELDGQAAIFDERSRTVEAAFDRVERVLPSGRSGPLASARALWSKTATDVARAKKLWGTDVISKELASGKDPFSDAWQRLRDAQADLTEVTAGTVADLRANTSRVNRVQSAIPPIVLGMLIIALLMGAWSARALSRRVVAPVIQLRDAVQRMRDGELASAVAIGPAAMELSELATAMSELGGSLQKSHGLLVEQATTDSLTGLPNRKGFLDHLQAVASASSTEGMTLFFVDLDDFKVVNDSMGHAAGDELLRIIAMRLRTSARDCDMVARLGGDEFAFVVDSSSDPAAAIRVAERVLDTLNEPVIIDGSPVTSGCSIGIAHAGSGGDSIEDLIRNADIAMYMAKSRGKNCFEVFAHTMHAEMMSAMTLKADLAHAVDRDELVVHYQPVVDLTTLDILGWEALVRWQHPERGLVAPMDFIPLAEQTGDIVQIGTAVLDRACRDLAESLCRPGTPPTWVSVNVSARQLSQHGFDDVVRATLARHDITPSSLIIEITEAALVTDTESAADVLAALQQEGVRIAIDDFGTGFSSLRYLQELPVDILKIDRSFVQGTQEGASTPGDMLQAVLSLGSSLGLEMIAEGIEQTSELERLRAVEQIAGQGFLFAKPMTLDVAIQFGDTYSHERTSPGSDVLRAS